MFVICSNCRVQLCTRPGQSFCDAWKAIKFQMDQKIESLSLRLALGSVFTFLNISEFLFPFGDTSLFDRAQNRMSYGTGRPAILKDDESIWQCRFLLRHPLAIEDDMRLVSMVELMAIRERITNHLSPYAHGPVDERTFEILRSAYAEFKHWYQTWDQAFSQKYEDAGTLFYQRRRTFNSPSL